MRVPEVRVVIPDKLELQIAALIRAGQAGNKAELVRSALVQYLSTMPTVSEKDYDSELVFSPDGRILQLEYAQAAADRGLAAVAVCCEEGVVFIKQTGINHAIPTWVAPTHRFIDHLNDKIAIASCGINPDARLVTKKARAFMIGHSSQDSDDLSDIADYIAEIIHTRTLQKNRRALGVNILIGGFDQHEVARLYSIDPSGSYWEVKAAAIGQQKQEAFQILLLGLSSLGGLEDAIQLGVAAVLQGKQNLTDCVIEVIDQKSKRFRELSLAERKKYVETQNSG